MAQNTEKPTGKQESKKQVIQTPKANKTDLSKAPVNEASKKGEVKTTEEAKPATKKPEVKKPVKKVKKSEVVVNARSVPVSTKYAVAISKFIKYKTPEKAIADLELVIKIKKAVPMRGEIPHRKGRMMSGRFPKRASEHFVILLKSLIGNAANHDVEAPVIADVISNQAQRPAGRFGAVKKKRTHITIIAKEMNQVKKERKIKEKKLKKK